MAANRNGIEHPMWKQRPRLSSQLQLHHSGQSFMLDKQLIAQKSEKIAKLLQKNPHEDLWRILGEINADQESVELFARFCYGYEINLSAENVVGVACLAKSLAMTDTHCRDNLVNKAISFFEKHVMHSWNNSIKALRSADHHHLLKPAQELGLIDCCFETLILKALEDPRLLGEPLMVMRNKEEEEEEEDEEMEEVYRPLNARRKLFDIDWKSEDLTTLPLRLYAPIIHGMIQRQVRVECIATNLCQYAKMWILSNDRLEEINAQRETIEALVRLFPPQIGLFPCKFLCEMLRFAVALEANAECRNALEARIGMQLDEASSKDVLIPCHVYEKYDTECLRRMLTHFYSKEAGLDHAAMSLVAELIDELLPEMAVDIDLKAMTFLEVVRMSIAASEAVERGCDGIYRAVDVYLEKHRHLTEPEREELCRVLEWNKMSNEALEHAAVNEKLPVRVVVQVLFATQLKLKEAINNNNNNNKKGMGTVEMQVEEESEEMRSGDEYEMRVEMEMEKMGSKVSELEKECFVMRREMSRCDMKKNQRKKKFSMWREMKRKFGCITTMHESDCLIKNKNKKKKVLHTR